LIFYVFIVVFGILAIHQRISEAHLEEKYSSKMNKEILDAVRGGSLNAMLGGDKHVKISPKYKEPPNEETDQPADTSRSSVLDEDDSEKILSDILDGGPAHHVKEEPREQEHHQVKVVGASVEDMLMQLGV
jgi:hypothetical protein